ncbi:hypothetical protein [Hymenobacter rigui]|uniref:Uncharacterized protein n=1 Tax=Hymenobacter rigui TaxID=334424 RepID=A0A428KSU2_9BACT|nr:hypothetical protein [Hymenobacter rigui]RSK49564.1 hypothetical protein EI291_08730 [Hymenobacter rigui]
MKVLVFPALLAVAIITTPPKPFVQAQAGKPLMATNTPTASTASFAPAHAPAQPAPIKADKPALVTEASTARR